MVFSLLSVLCYAICCSTEREEPLFNLLFLFVYVMYLLAEEFMMT